MAGRQGTGGARPDPLRLPSDALVPAGAPANPRIQATGRSGEAARSGRSSMGALWSVGLCGRELDGLQVICNPLGTMTYIADSNER